MENRLPQGVQKELPAELGRLHVGDLSCKGRVYLHFNEGTGDLVDMTEDFLSLVAEGSRLAGDETESGVPVAEWKLVDFSIQHMGAPYPLETALDLANRTVVAAVRAFIEERAD